MNLDRRTRRGVPPGRLCSARGPVSACLAAMVVAGCAGASTSGTGATSLPRSMSAPTSRSPSGSDLLLLDEATNRTSVHAHQGQLVEVDLHSSYWRPIRSSAPRVLHQEGRTLATPGRCAPGVGCGTFRSLFLAQAAGTARLTSDRVSCGEALACRPDQRSLAITVIVD